MGTTFELAFVKRYKDRHGKVRHYFRRQGYRAVPLPGLPGSAEFMAVYEEALNRPPESGPGGRPDSGSFEALFLDYYRSQDFRRLRPQTQSDYRSTLKDFVDRFGAYPVRTFRRVNLRKYLDTRSDTPGAASKFLKRIRFVLAFAVDRELIALNPADGVRFRRQASGGFPDWSEADIKSFETRWPLGTKPRLAFALLLYTGQRRSDVVRMGRQHIRDEEIEVRQVKGDRQLTIPLHPRLRAVLDQEPLTNLTFLLTDYGQPFSSKGFGKWWAERCKAAGVGDKRAHGLRKAAARRLAEAGCTAYQIIAVTGHASAKEAEPYTRAADQKRLARQAMRKIK